jgi:hypothetical protein
LVEFKVIDIDLSIAFLFDNPFLGVACHAADEDSGASVKAIVIVNPRPIRSGASAGAIVIVNPHPIRVGYLYKFDLVGRVFLI